MFQEHAAFPGATPRFPGATQVIFRFFLSELVWAYPRRQQFCDSHGSATFLLGTNEAQLNQLPDGMVRAQRDIPVVVVDKTISPPDALPLVGFPQNAMCQFKRS